ncbi:YncE family protein [Burkholderia alba]|uniref:YncE family protein n=1 Tax=Burkholderia alba TaxID=2683677 RepID=UPI002B05D46C|nr:YncE family protein [Burkholderia alba]
MLSMKQWRRALVSFAFALSSAGMPVHAFAAAGPVGELYVPEVDLNQIAVIDTATAKIVRRVPVNDIAVLPFGSRPAVLATTLDGGKIYSDNFGVVPPTVTIIDRRTGTTKSIKVGGVPLGAFTSLDGKEIYLPEVNFGVDVISTETDEIVRRLTFPDIPVASISGPDGNLYVGFATGFLGVYDPKTGRTIRPPIWSGGTLTFWFTFTQDGKKLYTDAVNTIGVIDMEKWKLVKTIPTSGRAAYLPTDPGAFTSTLSPDGKKLYVTLFGETGVLIVDVATDKIVGRIKTAGSTTGITFSADGTRGYISDMGASSAFLKTPLGEAVLFGNLIGPGLLGPGQIVVFDPATDAIVGEPIPTGPGPGISAWVPAR